MIMSDEDFASLVYDDIAHEVMRARESGRKLEERYHACRQLAALSTMTGSDFLLGHMLHAAGSCGCVREDLRRIMETLRFSPIDRQAKFILAVFMCGDNETGLIESYLTDYKESDYE